MRDTTSSVPDAASRGRDCAAPSSSSESQNKVTSVSSCADTTRRMRGRPVTHDEAQRSAQRLINSHFRSEDRARTSIPADYRDDDITVSDYIEEHKAVSHGFPIAVAAELLRARAKFPGTKNVTVALAEELGELSKALLDHSYGEGENDAVYKEAVQVAAMAQRVAEEGDPGFPYAPPPLPRRSDFIRELMSPQQQKEALALLVRIHDSREIVLYAPDFGTKVKRFLDDVVKPACEFCGPVCYGGAAHNARVEDNARFDDPKPTDSNATVLA